MSPLLRWSRSGRWALLAAALALGILGRSLPAWAAGEAAPAAHPREKTLMKRMWGIEVLFVRLAANGYMTELRYKVVDAARAKPLFDRSLQPVLIHERSQAAFAVPAPGKVGALRNSDPPVNGRTYWMFFANPAQYVKKGDTVTIQIGAFRAEGLTVQ